jgi:hypothetical protein
MTVITHGSGCACHPAMTYTPVSRRKLLAGAGALAAASALPKTARAQGKPKVIDTHHHFYAPAYQKAWLDWEDARKIPHFKTQEAWSREKAIEELDKNGVATGMLSLASTPPRPPTWRAPATISAPRWCATTRAASACSRRCR